MDVRKGSAWNVISTGEAFKSGAWRTLRYGEAYYSGAWRQIVSFVPPMTLSVPNFSGDSTSSTVEALASATVSGGQGPYSYVWALVSSSGTSSVVYGAAPWRATQLIDAYDVALGTPALVTMRCTVTDSLGETATDTGVGTFTRTSGA